MASIKKKTGGYQAQIAIKGVREARTFSTKAEAVAWSAERETEIRKQVGTCVDVSKTCRDAFDRYVKTVSVGKKSVRWERNRLSMLGMQLFGKRMLRDIPLAGVTSEMLGEWRDRRLSIDKVVGSTINRDLNLLSNVFTIARKEWKWVAESPTTGVRRPKNPAPRERLITDDEIERITLASGFDEMPVHLVKQRVGVAFLFAIESAMRASELCGLKSMDVVGSVATLLDTKNGTNRDVPLSGRALELLTFLPAVEPDERVFGLSSSALDANFRKMKIAAGIDGMTFHDTRHLAITRLAKKLNVLELARMVGHRDLRMLQIYYNESAENIAAKLL
ncbi:MAG: site-specific integrase [Burkholderiaceae bacterium]|nr:site-specific integrase [Burkholderiaceae bacterium]